jgi:hypothetical protein
MGDLQVLHLIFLKTYSPCENCRNDRRDACNKEIIWAMFMGPDLEPVLP